MSEAFDRLCELVTFLRGEKGCPWDRDQTLDSLRPHLLEEMHEVCEAIEENNILKLKEEIGDALFLLLFVTRVAEEEGRFSIDDVLLETYAKMKQRHPHVFGERKDLEPDEVLDQWERRKKAQTAEDESVLSGVPKRLPALIKAQRIQQRAASLGFDWETVESVFQKLKEEIREFEEAWKARKQTNMSEEVGDILFSLVNVSRFLSIRAEDALQSTITKFKQRFAEVEKEIVKRGRMTLEEMDQVWEKSKRKDD